MMNNPLNQWFCGVCLLLVLLKVDGLNVVDITVLDSAVSKGAVCLDGSPPAYHFDKGFEDGVNNWIVFLMGGSWCNNVSNCAGRAATGLGSSKQMEKNMSFGGILNNQPYYNPDFYNWNRIMVRYCDGASFTGDVEVVDPATNLHFRGARIFKAVVNELLAKGMKDADRVVLAGCSAGGLSVIHNCDGFQKMLPLNSTTLKCVTDAGYFINIKDVSGAGKIEAYYDQVVDLHGSTKNLAESCTSKMKPSLCFFPQYIAPQIKTPIFFVNAAYDTWQIGANLVPNSTDPQGLWTACKNDLAKCSVDQMITIQNFHVEFLNAFKEVGTSPLRGFYINGCYTHCQTTSQDIWFEANSPKLFGKTIANAVGDWVYDRSPFQMYGTPYPCDKTCNNYVKV